MNAERLLAQFERISEAPDAIARLRRFILDLAVRGKLVEQDPSDESAEELLNHIAAEKARLKKLGVHRDPRSHVHIKREDLAFVPPTHWQWVRLIDIASASYGFAFASSNFNASRSGVPLIRIRDIANTDTEAYYEGDYDPSYIVKAGDYLVGMDGNFNLRQWKGEDGLLNQRVLRLNGWRCGVVSEYIKLPLQAIFHHIHEVSSLTTVKHLSAKQVNGIEIPLPPLAEQHRIVAKVDELMALCDQLEAARQQREQGRERLIAATLQPLNQPAEDPASFRKDASFALQVLPSLTTTPAQIKQLRQTILNLAVLGKLVPQDPSDEPVSELLKQIANVKARRVSQGTLREQKPLPPVEDSEIEFELARGWGWARMAEVIKLWNGFAFKSGDFQSVGVPVIRIGDLQDGVVTLSGAACVSEAVASTVGPNVWIPPDALLIAMSGATTGKTAFNRTGIPILLNQRVGRIEVFLTSIDFLRFFLETIVARNLSISFGTAIPNLSAQQINNTVIPLPPLAEQHRIVAKVDELMALCDQLEQQLSQADQQHRRLLEAVLAEALGGRLTVEEESHANVA